MFYMWNFICYRPECQKQVSNFKYAKYRKFNTEQEAAQFVNGFDSPGGNIDVTHL